MWISVWMVVLGAAGVMAEKANDPQMHQRLQTTSAASVPTSSNSTQGNINIRPADCADYLMAGFTSSGVYEIHPFTCACTRSVQVWCDMEADGGGWTVFLKRQNQTDHLDFNRTWDEYREGFGNITEEYWLGNELLHHMTFGREYAIRIDVQYASGGSDYATYERFRIDNEDNRYRTTVSGRLSGSTTTTRCLTYIGNRYFTTRDRDYDSYSGNCAANQGGAWWYYNCRNFNPTSTYSESIKLVCNSSSQKVTSLQVKIRPAICDESFKTIHMTKYSCGCNDPTPAR